MSSEPARSADTERASEGRYDRLGAADGPGMFVRFDRGFGLNVHIGMRQYRDDWSRVMQERDLLVLGIQGWERLCELVDEWRARTAHNDGADHG